MNFAQSLAQGGLVLNIVFALLLVMSCASWYLIFLKSLRLRREYRCYHEFFAKYATNKIWASMPDLTSFLTKILAQEIELKSVKPEIANSNPNQNFQTNKPELGSKKSIFVLHFLLAEVIELHKNLSAADSTTKRKEVITMHLLQTLDEIRFSLDRGLTILASIGSCAPFIGLFGTVWGIYHALSNIAAQGSMAGNAGLNMVAGPVGEALIATAFGLFAAIPAILAYNSFVRLNRVLLQNLRHLAEQIEAWQN